MIARAAFAVVRVARRWLSSRGESVSYTWLQSQAALETRAGWDGPRWRTPAERKRMAREDRRKALSVVPSQMRRSK